MRNIALYSVHTIESTLSKPSSCFTKSHIFFNSRNQKLVYFDYGFTCIFAIEVSLKLIDYGVILHPGSYLRELWNIMDLLVVSCAITSFSMDML